MAARAPVTGARPTAHASADGSQRRSLAPIALAAAAATGFALVVYAATALRGVSFGDWAEMQQVPARLEVPHTTGFPLYAILGWLFSLLPIGSVAYRADLLSAAAGAGAVGTAVLIAGRLGVRPVIALAGAIALAGTSVLWEESTFAEMNGLHMLLSGLLVHRALVWRDEHRDRDLRLGALIAGLSLSNHLLALSVVPVVGLWVAVAGGWQIVRRPRLLVECALLFALGLSFYLFIVVRALIGPPNVYGWLAGWEGFRDFVTGAKFRTDMRFGTRESVVTAINALPVVVDSILRASNWLFVAVPVVGAVLLGRRDRWAASLLLALVATNVYMFAGYRGDLDHYLLLTWLVLTVWLVVALEAAVAWVEPWAGTVARAAQVGLTAGAVLWVASGWTAHDQSGNRLGERFADEVFASLAPNAVLVSYWDVLTTLGYARCIEGDRPDVALVTFDVDFTGACNPEVVGRPLEELAATRPMYALFIHEWDLDRLRASFDLVPERTIRLPYGRRYPEHDRPLFRLVPRTPTGQAPRTIGRVGSRGGVC